MELEVHLEQLDKRMEGIVSGLESILRDDHIDEQAEPELEVKSDGECPYGSVRCSDGRMRQIVPIG